MGVRCHAGVLSGRTIAVSHSTHRKIGMYPRKAVQGRIAQSKIYRMVKDVTQHGVAEMWLNGMSARQPPRAPAAAFGQKTRTGGQVGHDCGAVFMAVARPFGDLGDAAQTAHAQTRVGVDDDIATINCVLPAAAAHNLVFGSEMVLAARPGAAAVAVVTGGPAESPYKTIDDVMNKFKTKVSFEAKSLEFAMQDIASDVNE